MKFPAERVRLLFWMVPLAATMFSVFPLTDTDIWWHLACAREWVQTWTPSRSPVVNVHEFFQQSASVVYGFGGAPSLVAFKALLWGMVFALFLWPVRTRLNFLWAGIAVVLLFVFRYQLECRPVLLSLVFLGIDWNVIPWLFRRTPGGRTLSGTASCRLWKVALVSFALLGMQWVWCLCQGLFILGPLLAVVMLWGCGRWTKFNSLWTLSLFLMPFLHGDGLRLLLYPLGLLDRLLGLSASAVVFSTTIAENRSPLTLLFIRENFLQSGLMVALTLMALALVVWRLGCLCGQLQGRSSRMPVKMLMEALVKTPAESSFDLPIGMRGRWLWLLWMAALALVAERNFVLFLPVFLMFSVVVFGRWMENLRRSAWIAVFALAATLGGWCRSVAAYDLTMVASQRIPVGAAQWMRSHPHAGRLFNDDRTGGYLAFVNPSDSTYIDGRFILKTDRFFERYLQYAERPETFLRDADSLGIDRLVLPLRYYSRWGGLISALVADEHWHFVYRDSLYVVMDRKKAY